MTTLRTNEVISLQGSGVVKHPHMGITAGTNQVVRLSSRPTIQLSPSRTALATWSPLSLAAGNNHVEDGFLAVFADSWRYNSCMIQIYLPIYRVRS